MSFLVIEPGLESRTVDLGRLRTRNRGVPIGGPADRGAFALANALAGNPLDALSLEIAVKGPVLRAEVDLACALVGAPFVMTRDGTWVEVNSSFSLPKGQELRIAGCPRGMRAYLAVARGFDGRMILGSKSGLAPLRAGDRLSCRTGEVDHLRLPSDCPVLLDRSDWRLRVTSGPQADWFPSGALVGHTYVVDHASNRMGIRLDGVPLPPASEMISEPVCPGCVQITREGLPIILGVDGQTIGGYPKIAVVIDADLDALGQVRPGDRVRFIEVNDQTARRAASERTRELAEWTTRIAVLTGTTASRPSATWPKTCGRPSLGLP